MRRQEHPGLAPARPLAHRASGGAAGEDRPDAVRLRQFAVLLGHPSLAVQAPRAVLHEPRRRWYVGHAEEVAYAARDRAEDAHPQRPDDQPDRRSDRPVHGLPGHSAAVVGGWSRAVDLICAAGGDSVSSDEWAKYLPGVPYEPVC